MRGIFFFFFKYEKTIRKERPSDYEESKPHRWREARDNNITY